MDLKKEFSALVETLKTERDELQLKLHLGSMEVKEEFEGLDEKWDEVVAKASELADDSVEISEEVVAKAKAAAEEVKEVYQRLAAKLSGDSAS